ncbi:formate dehydrogenase subunit gamma [Ferrimonas sp. YFM]|uniref:formate dehydrogenase subunit gamma n=1 Tax=Ferrimonas sp. YFM TaxID=3028878 RepID=UPI0025739C61|nr:formate dehydrogenase subunit gamma [Ferrimonas sp. YFM]BDY06953.1 formate dehydrogenase subunit gamma [Ferrimonas sp. YFM]
MKRFIALLQMVLVAAFAGQAVAAEKAELQPQQWQPIQEVTIPGDIPELRGMPVSPDLPVVNTAVNEGYLQTLSPASYWADILTYSFFGMIALLTLFVMINGKSKLHGGFSGKKVDRWSGMDIFVHWLGGIACLFLIITGLIMGAGRFLLEPNMGVSHWVGVINTSVSLHDMMAWPFIIGWAVMVLKWLPKQLPESCDAAWFAKAGGYLNFGPFKGQHPDAGFANAGEKLWFWTFAICGALIVGSGLVMMFPTLVETKDGANLSLVLHLVSAAIIGAFAVVHIFMATVMSEGGMECMVTGKCDENWAKQHHNLWFKQVSKS